MFVSTQEYKTEDQQQTKIYKVKKHQLDNDLDIDEDEIDEEILEFCRHHLKL